MATDLSALDITTGEHLKLLSFQQRLHVEAYGLRAWDANALAYVKLMVDGNGALVVSGGSSGGGGAVTVANGADVAEGATTDAAVTTDVNATISAKLRGLVKILGDVWNSNNHVLQIGDGNGSLTVDGTVTANQGTTPWNVGGNINAAQAGAPWTVDQTKWNGNAVDVNAGNKSSGTLRVVLATDQPALTNNLNVADGGGSLTVDGTVTANQGGAPWAENVTQFGGNNVVTGTGAGGAGVPRVTMSNDSALAANQTVDISRIAGVAASVNEGAAGAGSLRVTLAQLSGNSNIQAEANVSLGQSTGKTNVLKTGTLTTINNTANQVVLTYTVTVNKTFYLEYVQMHGHLATLSATATILGTETLESAAGTPLLTVDKVQPTTAGYDDPDFVFPEPVPINSNTVVRVVASPSVANNVVWRANFGGYEK